MPLELGVSQAYLLIGTGPWHLTTDPAAVHAQEAGNVTSTDLSWFYEDQENDPEKTTLNFSLVRNKELAKHTCTRTHIDQERERNDKK